MPTTPNIVGCCWPTMLGPFAWAFRMLSICPAGPTSQFLNGTHEFSGLVPSRMALLVDQSRSVPPLRSAKAREFGELWRENVRARSGPFYLNWPGPVLFGRPEQQMESDCVRFLLPCTKGLLDAVSPSVDIARALAHNLGWQHN